MHPLALLPFFVLVGCPTETTSVEGCTNSDACNFDPSATLDDGSCESPPDPLRSCNGDCLADVDGDSICDEEEVVGCTDTTACNFDELATDDGDCVYAEANRTCDGDCLEDVDNDLVCDPEEVAGCTEPLACNYEPMATDDDGSCDLIGQVESYTPVATESMVAGSSERVAQTFTATQSIALDEVVLPIYTCKPNGLVDARVDILGTASGTGEPSVTLASSSVVANSELGDSCFGGGPFEDETFTFDPPLSLTAGEVYGIELIAEGSASGALFWRRSSTPADPSDPSPGGSIWMQSEIFQEWQPITDLDLAFRATGCPTTP